MDRGPAGTSGRRAALGAGRASCHETGAARTRPPSVRGTCAEDTAQSLGTAFGDHVQVRG